jgi:uncharacterized damage-inducible protein DinB
MNIQDILTIYDYNYWATRQILVASMHVNPEQLITPTVHSFGSLRGTLVHTLDSESGWRMLLQHSSSTEVSMYVFEQTHERDRCTIAGVGRDERTQ